MPLGGKISAGAGRIRRPPLFDKYALLLCGKNHHSLFDHRTGKRKRAKTGGLRKKSGSVVTKEEKSYENIKIWRKQSFSVLR